MAVGPEVVDWCRASGLDYILGIAPTTTLRRHVEGLEASTKARFEAAPRTVSFVVSKENFRWRPKLDLSRADHRPRRSGHGRPDTSFVVADLSKRNARRLYEDVYCRRGQAENHINPLENPVWRRIVGRAPRRQPTPFGCYCMRARTG